MAISGKNFLHVTASDLVITDHALLRISQHAHVCLTRTEARRCFQAARHRRHGELAEAGYHPDYLGRLAEGVKSWYFDLEIGDSVLLAVAQQTGDEHDLVWVTTYPPGETNAAGRTVRPN